MIVRSPRPANHFTLLRNDVLRDKRLSFKARGLLAYLLSFPDNWRISGQALARSGPDGYTSVLSGMAELRDCGYVRTVKTKDDQGRFITTTYVYDVPGSPAGNGAEVDDLPESGNPTPEKPTPEKPTPGNPLPLEDCSKEDGIKKTVNAAAQRLARIYSEQVPLSNFPAVMGVAKKALNAGYEEQTINDALTRLATDGRPVTVDTLRVEIEGLPARSTRRTRTMDEFAALTAWAQAEDEKLLPKEERRGISGQ